MKQRDRAKRDWPQHGDIDCDYATGREFTGTWKAMPSEEPREKYNAPLVGGPQTRVMQFDKTLSE